MHTQKLDRSIKIEKRKKEGIFAFFASVITQQLQFRWFHQPGLGVEFLWFLRLDEVPRCLCLKN
jgi:hypothetical protein